MLLKISSVATMLAIASMVGCDDDDSMAPVATQDFEVRIENVSQAFAFPDFGVFNTPVGEAGPGPAFPGGQYQFTFRGLPGHRLSFATMFVQSNDFFYAPDEGGIELYDGNQPRTGIITQEIQLWDGGTEIDQEPGLGDAQAPRQAGPDAGAADPDNRVRLAADAFNNLPAVDEVLEVRLEYLGDAEFRLTIENVSTGATIPTSDGGSTATPLAPGVYVVHTDDAPLFTIGAADRGEGLEAIAEDGDPSGLAAVLDARTGLTSPLAPGVFLTHTDDGILFESGVADFGDGLEALAEDGDPSGLAAALGGMSSVFASGAFNTPEGAGGPGPLFPGSAYTFMVSASPGQRLSLATMLVQSNDLFFAPDESGIALFNGDAPRSGDVTSEFLLWDAGTEVNQAPGFGADQAPRQAGPDTGPEENGVVRVVDNPERYPEVGAVIRVTITPVS